MAITALAPFAKGQGGLIKGRAVAILVHFFAEVSAFMKGAGNLMMNAVGGIYMSSRKSVNTDASADVLMSAGADRTDTVVRDQMPDATHQQRVGGKEFAF